MNAKHFSQFDGASQVGNYPVNVFAFVSHRLIMGIRKNVVKGKLSLAMISRRIICYLSTEQGQSRPIPLEVLMAFFLPSSIRNTERREFASQVCRSLWDLAVKGDKFDAIMAVYNDGSDAEVMALPGAARYAAERLTCSWRVVFDWRDGKCHTVNIQLPDEVART